MRIDAAGVHSDGADVTRLGANETVIDGNGGQRSINCAGGVLSLTGNGNNVSAAGCLRISVTGNGNTVQARFDRTGAVRVLGNHNTIFWSGPRETRVAVSNLGTGNSIARR